MKAAARLDDDPMGFRQLLEEMAADRVRGGYGWVMSGGTGTGKTVRAKLAAKAAGIRFRRADDIVAEMAGTDGGIGALEDAGCLGLGHFTRRTPVDDLVIDDLGRELPSINMWGTRRDVMREILERRLDAWPHIRTYATTNLTREQLEQRYGARVLSRLAGSTLWLPMQGPDRRIGHGTGW